MAPARKKPWAWGEPTRTPITDIEWLEKLNEWAFIVAVIILVPFLWIADTWRVLVREPWHIELWRADSQQWERVHGYARAEDAIATGVRYAKEAHNGKWRIRYRQKVILCDIL